MGSKLKKVSAGILAGVIVFAMVLTGTYAWQSISQRATNETGTNINPGGRLHDDFNGTNKDVYVENFTDVNNEGVPIYARIRLYEYMEIGDGAGLKEGEEGYENKAVTVLGATGSENDPDINKPSTWLPHIPAQHNVGASANPTTNPFHSYWTWNMGGSTVYMPTFNTNKDSLEAEINGSYANQIDYNGDSVADPYEDYKSYNVGDTELGFEIWDIDDNDDDELAAGGIDIQKVIEMDTTAAGTVETDPAYTDSVELNKGTDGNGVTHTAKETLPATVITMAEWMAMGSPVNENYWVYDTDGWAYWAAPIEPGTATGLLLDGISVRREADGKAYYAIHVVAQFASRGDWGAEDNTGFYDPNEGSAPTPEALYLLNKAAGMLPTVTGISIQEGYKAYALVGETLTLNADVYVEFPSGSAAETAVKWSIAPSATNFADGSFIPNAAQAESTFRVTATSKYDSSFSTFIDVYVLPVDALGVETDGDGNTYVKYKDNTHRLLNPDNTLDASYIFAGDDGIIGSGDDEPVELVTPAHATYGSKFRGPDAYGCYLAVGPDNQMGTEDDVLVAGNPWPNGIYSPKATDVAVSATDNAKSIQQNGTLQMSALVTLCGTPITNQSVTWTVTGDTTIQDGTAIDANGLLTIDVYETVGNVLTVTAESDEQPGLIGEYKLTVAEWTVAERINSVSVNSSDTVPIDGYDWYVLVNDGTKALLWSAEVVHTTNFGSDNPWQDSTLRTYLNNDFYNKLTTMKPLIPETSLTTLEETGSSNFITTDDHVFLLSEADVFGQHNGTNTTEAQHYTYGAQKLITNSTMLTVTPAVICWLRSPRYNHRDLATVSTTGTSSHGGFENSYGVRPALWVNLGS